MEIYDISLTITESIPTWPGDFSPKFTQTLKLKEGDNANVTHLSLSAHTGTHVDPPGHFLDGGSWVDTLPLDILVGPALVVDALDAWPR